MRFVWLPSVATLLVTLTVAAQGERPPERGPRIDRWQSVIGGLQEFDVNRNQVIDADELEQAVPKVFGDAKDIAKQVLAKFDADGDGKLSPAERRAMMELMRLIYLSRTIADLDPDGDFAITAEEEARAKAEIREKIEEYNRQVLANLDTNFDGVISKEEQEAAARRNAAEPATGPRREKLRQ